MTTCLIFVVFTLFLLLNQSSPTPLDLWSWALGSGTKMEILLNYYNLQGWNQTRLSATSHRIYWMQWGSLGASRLATFYTLTQAPMASPAAPTDPTRAAISKMLWSTCPATTFALVQLTQNIILCPIGVMFCYCTHALGQGCLTLGLWANSAPQVSKYLFGKMYEAHEVYLFVWPLGGALLKEE